MKTRPIQLSISINVPFKFLNLLLVLFYSFSGFLFYKALLRVAYFFSSEPLAENFRGVLSRYGLGFVAPHLQGLSFLAIFLLVGILAYYFPSSFLLESEAKKPIALKIASVVAILSFLILLFGVGNFLFLLI